MATTRSESSLGDVTRERQDLNNPSARQITVAPSSRTFPPDPFPPICRDYRGEDFARKIEDAVVRFCRKYRVSF